NEADSITFRNASDKAREEARRRREETLHAEIAGRLGAKLPDTIPAPLASDLPSEWPSHALSTSNAAQEPVDQKQSAPVNIVQSLDEPAAPPEVLKLLHDAFGYPELRDGQASVIVNVLDGVDTLAIM